MTETTRILASTSGARAIARELNRRNFFALAAAGAVGALAGCSGGGGSSSASSATSASPAAGGGALEDALSIYTWGEYDSPDVIKAFTTDKGPKITLDSYSSNEEMISKLVAAKGTGGYDIVVPTGTYLPQMVENGLLQKINRDLLPNLQYMDKQFLGQAWDPTNEYSICKAWGTSGFVYDTTVVKRELKTWADFLDCAQKEASGKTSLLDDLSEVASPYFWANGIDWTTTDAAHLDAAEAFMVDKLAPHIAAFDSYPGGGAIPQGTHVLMHAWNGDARIGLAESKTPERWKWVLGAPTTELWMDNWTIVAGAPHPEAAHAWINYTMDPANQLKQLDYIGYHTGAAGIQDAATKAGLKRLDMVFFTPEQLATMKNGALNEGQQRRVDIWNKVKAKAASGG